jgi:hypothetical protein
MAILLSSLTLAFVAFFIWLTIRYVNRRERWVKWTLVAALVLPVAYVVSFGPACWLSSHAERGEVAVTWVYYPLGRLCAISVEEDYLPRIEALVWYSQLYAAAEWDWTCFVDDGHGQLVLDEHNRVVWHLEWNRDRPQPVIPGL